MSSEKVYLDYTQEELNAQYNQATLVPDLSPFMAWWQAETKQAQSGLKWAQNIAYGEHPDMRLDLYGTDLKNAPLMVFFHGGAWWRLSKEESGFPALAFAEAGIQYAAVEFSLAPKASLDEMVDQCRRSIAYLSEHGPELGIDPSRIHVMGHSSGSHLAAMVATTDWPTAYGLPADTIKGLSAISGGYDLAPVRLSARNEYLHLDEAAARRNTPNNALAHLSAPAIVAWGGKELAEFQRQGQALAAAVTDQGGEVETIFLADKNHFELSRDYCDFNSPLFQAIVAQTLRRSS